MAFPLSVVSCSVSALWLWYGHLRKDLFIQVNSFSNVRQQRCLTLLQMYLLVRLAIVSVQSIGFLCDRNHSMGEI